MAFAEAGHRREERPDKPVSFLMVLHGLQREYEKPIELTASPLRSCFFCSSRDSRKEAALSESVPLGLGARRIWLFPLDHATLQDCWMLPRYACSHRQEVFCCNPTWYVGNWSHQHTDWGLERRDDRWCEMWEWRFVDVNDLISYDVYAQQLNLWLFWRLIYQRPLQPHIDKRGKTGFLLRTGPASEK